MMRFLTLICIAAMVCGCAGDDRYAMEKEGWYLRKMEEHITANPMAAPREEIERVVKRFSAFSARYPDTPLGINAEFGVARIYMLKNDTAAARRQLEEVVRRHASPEIKAEGYFLIGRTYQDEDWPTALAYYARVAKDYPLTKRGLGVSVYVAEYYRDHFEPAKMVTAYEDAITRYTEIAAANPASPIAFETRLMISSCYAGLKDWRSCVTVLEGVAEEFKGKVALDVILMNIALIYKNELRDMGCFRGALERLVRDYPGSGLVPTARALMKASDEGKQHRAG